MHKNELNIERLMLVSKDFNSVNIFYLEQMKQYLIDKVLQQDL